MLTLIYSSISSFPASHFSSTLLLSMTLWLLPMRAFTFALILMLALIPSLSFAFALALVLALSVPLLRHPHARRSRFHALFPSSFLSLSLWFPSLWISFLLSLLLAACPWLPLANNFVVSQGQGESSLGKREKGRYSASALHPDRLRTCTDRNRNEVPAWTLFPPPWFWSNFLKLQF